MPSPIYLSLPLSTMKTDLKCERLLACICSDFFPLFEFFITYSVGLKGKGTCNIIDTPGESLDYDLADRAPMTLNSLSFFLFGFFF